METLSFTVPANTTGMGNPTAPNIDTGEMGSGDMLQVEEPKDQKKKKKMKTLKDYLKDKK